MIEKLISACARHRGMVFAVVAAATVGAWHAIRATPLDAIPDLSDPQVIVFTEWMGRSPTLVEDQVTYPIASSLLAAPKVTDVRGYSMFGMSFIYVLFEEGTDVYWARSRVLEYLSTLRGRLPAGANPVLGPDATGIGWVFQYALVDKTGRRDLGELRAFQDFHLRYALAAVPGVAEVASVGGYEKQYQVTVDPNRLVAYGLTLAEVSQAIRRSNNDVGGRVIEMSGREYFIRGRGYVQDLGDIERVVVRATSQGTPVLVRDLGTVRFGGEIRRGLAELDGEGEAVGAIVVMRYGENALGVIERVKQKIESLKSSFPEGTEVGIVYDRSALIERSIATLRRTLLEEGIVVSLVIIAFLLHLRSSLVPILSLPISVAAAFLPMRALGLSSNIMSLGGIAIAIGAMVDAAIVLVENAHKKLENEPQPPRRPIDPGRLLRELVEFSPLVTVGAIVGRRFFDAPAAGLFAGVGVYLLEKWVRFELRRRTDAERRAEERRTRLLIEAATEVGPAIFFSLLIITVAFLPIFGLEGQAGRLFKPLAFTKTFAMAMAAVVSVTLAPALMTLFVRGRIFPEKNHPVSRLLIGLYKPFVYVALRRPRTTVAIGVAAVVSAVPIASRLGSEFMPPLNEGDILYMPITFPNVSIEEAKRHLQVQDRLLRTFPEVESVFGKIGRAETATDPAPLSMVETVVRLKPPEEWRRVPVARWFSGAPGFVARPLSLLWPTERPITWDELISQMNRRLQLPGWTNAWTMPIKTRVDMLTTGVRTPIGVKVFGTDLAEIERLGTELETLLAPIPATRSAYYERSQGGLYVDILPDRRALARYGLTVGDVEDIVEAAIGGQVIGFTVEGRRRFSINVRYPRDLRDSVENLRRVLVPVHPGAPASGGMGGMGPSGTRPALPWEGRAALAQAMPGMGGAPAPGAAPLVGMGGGGLEMPALDTGMQIGVAPMPVMDRAEGMGAGAAPPPGQGARVAHVPLGQVADVRVASGPPMIRDEAGMLVGYLYVDIDTGRRDVGGYVAEAKRVVQQAVAAGRLRMPPGYYLKWTGQYELLERMEERMRVLVPLTLLVVIVLLFLHFRNLTETFIVLLSVPFALVGSVWLLYLLGYYLSTAVWVGVIALVGLAAQTGIVMIVYLDAAYERRKRAGKIRDLNDIIWAHMEGTVQRVRPKLMTVATMMIGLVPLLWSTGTGADVMKRIAAPMVGGLITSAFLTLEIIPVVYTYWRLAQLKAEERRAAEAGHA